jgi:hypothetical protein
MLKDKMRLLEGFVSLARVLAATFGYVEQVVPLRHRRSNLSIFPREQYGRGFRSPEELLDLARIEK